jgi:hypothetical protein
VTAKQAERLVKEFRNYLDTIRDAAIRAKGKAEVCMQCDVESDAEKRSLSDLFNGMAGIVKTVDLLRSGLPALEAVLAGVEAGAKS